MNGSYQLYGDLGSGSCVVELTLAELGADYVTREVALESDAQRGDAYRRVNPQRKLPSLVRPDGSVLTESVAILLALLEEHPAHRLLPAVGHPVRAQALRWLLFVATELYPIVEIVDYPVRFTAEAADPEATRGLARGIWRSRWQVVEQHVAGPFLLGERLCVTDLYIAVVSRWAQQDAWRPDNLPKVEAIAAAVAARPACTAIWHRHFPN